MTENAQITADLAVEHLAATAMLLVHCEIAVQARRRAARQAPLGVVPLKGLLAHLARVQLASIALGVILAVEEEAAGTEAAVVDMAGIPTVPVEVEDQAGSSPKRVFPRGSQATAKTQADSS